MDLSTLNLSTEQMVALNTHITESNTTFGQSEGDKVRTDYSKKMKLVEDELVKYKPVTKTEGELALDVRLKALEDKEKELLNREKLTSINTKLTEQGLPSQFSKYLQNSENVETEITSLKEMFNSFKIDGSFKPNTHGSGAESITKEKFNKMGYGEKSALYKSNPDLYERLSK